MGCQSVFAGSNKDEFTHRFTSPSMGEVAAKPQVGVMARTHRTVPTPTLRVYPPHKGGG